MQGSEGTGGATEPVPRRSATVACACVLIAFGLLLAIGALPRGTAAALAARADAWRPWTWLTSGLVQPHPAALCRDVLFLLAFGTLIETRLGPRALLAMLAGGVVATALLAQLWLAGAGPVRIQGAAGGVNLLAGAALVLLPRMGLRITVPVPFDAHVRALFGLWITLQILLLPARASEVAAIAQAFGALGGALIGIALRRRARPEPHHDAQAGDAPWRTAAGLRAVDDYFRTRPRAPLVDDWFWLVASLAAWSFAAVLLTLAIGGWNDAHARGTAVMRLALGLLCAGLGIAALVRGFRE